LPWGRIRRVTSAIKIKVLNWLREALVALRKIVNDANRSSEVIRRIRDFSKKADPEMIQLDINEVVEEAVSLVRH
jgi:phosphoglycerate-specific signal transduction histidine kinase